MVTNNLPEMYACSPQVHPMLQLLRNTSVKANSLNANMSASTGFFVLKGPIMVIQQVTL